jgi:Na+/proline symporter
MVFWAVLLVGVASLTREVTSVLNAAFALSGLTNGAMLGGLALALWWRRGSALPVIVGMVTALGVMVALYVGWRQVIAWPWYTLIGSALTVGVALAVRTVVENQKGTGPKPGPQ